MSRITALIRLALFLALAGFLGLGASAFARSQNSPGSTLTTVRIAELPQEARQTLRLIRQGGPYPFPRKDGSTFGNYEKLLPSKVRGYYREYTVPTPGRQDRGARRIVAGAGENGNVATSGEYYYTHDHYRSFRRILEP